MFKKIALALLTTSLATAAFANGEVNVYSARKEQLIKPLFDKFTEQTGIKVNLVTGKDDALLERLKLEGENTPADPNTYYYGQMLTSEEAADKAAAEKVAIFWPNQQDRGTHINISGAAVTKVAKNKDNAVKLMEFLVSDDSQKWYAEANQEYPVKAGVAPSEMLKGWGEFKADSLNLSELGKNNAEAVKIMDKAGWK